MHDVWHNVMMAMIAKLIMPGRLTQFLPFFARGRIAVIARDHIFSFLRKMFWLNGLDLIDNINSHFEESENPLICLKD